MMACSAGGRMAGSEVTEAGWRRTALDAMLEVQGFDVVIVCTGTEKQAAYWQERLERGVGRVIPSTCQVICVYEDWNVGGAGNGLGTLYAWEKAQLKNPELGEKLKRGEISAALYHTAGKGTRLAPLPGAENNNKPGVKLPAVCEGLGENGSSAPLTILESVVKQTGIYAASRMGRLSVFWGDQIFVPTVDFKYAPTAHADILCSLGPMPSAEEWKERGLEKYGLIAVAKSGAACQIEKVDHKTAVEYTSELGSEIVNVGTSLGSFSVSSSLLRLLTCEFSQELKDKNISLDTDPHWWMPATLPLNAYMSLMKKKGVFEDESKSHYARIRTMLEKLPKENHILGPVDVGANAYWWDYGQLKLYLKNAFRLILKDDVEADAMREFMSVKLQNNSALTDVTMGVKSTIKGNCVMANVKVEHLEAHNSIAVNCTAKKLVLGKNSLAYNVLEENELILEDGEVVTDIFMPDGSKIRQRSHIDVDGGTAWKLKLDNNIYSFETIYKTNLTTDVQQTAKDAQKQHLALAQKLSF